LIFSNQINIYLEHSLRIKIIDLSEERAEGTPKSPSMKYTHYATKGIVTLVEGSIDDVIDYMNQQIMFHNEIKVAILCLDEYVEQIHAKIIARLGSIDCLETIGANLFFSYCD